MKTNKKIRFWVFYHLGFLVFSFLAAMLMKYNQMGKAIVPQTYLVFSTIFVLCVCIGYLAIYMIKRAGELTHEQLNKKIVPAFIIFLALSFIIANLVVSIGVFIWYLIRDIPLENYIPNLFKYELSFASLSLLRWYLYFSIAFFFILWRKSAKKEQAFREEKLKFQYQSLKSQINPHFLFNSFGTLSELVYEDAKKADEYIQELSKIYRYIIEKEENKLVPLKDELDFVRRYFALHLVRSGNNLSIKITIDEPEKIQVIPVSVQTLVENCLKHNSSTPKSPLIVEIFDREGYLVVKNNLQRKNTLEPSTQKGLNILEQQVKLITGRNLQIIENNNEFIVKLPIIS